MVAVLSRPYDSTMDLDCEHLGHDRPCRRNPGCPMRWALDPGWGDGLRFAAHVKRVLDQAAPVTLRTGRGMTWAEMSRRLAWYQPDGGP